MVKLSGEYYHTSNNRWQLLHSQRFPQLLRWRPAFQPVALMAALEIIILHEPVKVSLDLPGALIPGLAPSTRNNSSSSVLSIRSTNPLVLGERTCRPVLDILHGYQRLGRRALRLAAELAPKPWPSYPPKAETFPQHHMYMIDLLSLCLYRASSL